MKVIVSAGGRFHAHRLAQQLAQRNALQRLYTFDYARADRSIVATHHVKVAPICKALDQTFRRLQLQQFINRARFNAFKDGLFDTFVSRKLADEPTCDLFVVWAHYALNSLRQARAKGAKIVLESGSCHVATHDQLLQQEYARFNLPFTPFDATVKEKTLQEYAAADYMVVPSTFVRDSFIANGIAPEKVVAIPYGVDVAFFTPAITAAKPERFIALFVGMVSLQKGIHYLLKAWQQAALPLSQTELWIVGNHQKDYVHIASQLPTAINIKFIPGVSPKHLKNIYQQASVLVLPSIQEGFGLVLGEAMASGLPLIASTHTGATDLITPGREGFLYNPYDTQALAQHLVWCYNHREEASQMGMRGATTIKKFTWDRYGEQVYEQYKKFLR